MNTPKEIVEHLRKEYLSQGIDPNRSYTFDEIPSLIYNLYVSKQYEKFSDLKKKEVIEELLSPFKPKHK